jgi:hypothetical protein
MMCYAYNYEATKQNDMGRQLSRGYGVLYQTRTENRAESEERTFMVLHRVCYIGSLGHTLLSMLYCPCSKRKKRVVCTIPEKIGSLQTKKKASTSAHKVIFKESFILYFHAHTKEVYLSL